MSLDALFRASASCTVIMLPTGECRTPPKLSKGSGSASDIASGNIVLHETAVTEEADESFVVEKGTPSTTLRFRGALRRLTSKKRKGARYYFIDFGLSCAFDSYEKRHKVYGVCGQHRDVPELSEEVAYDPFKVDMRQLGETLRKDFAEVSPPIRRPRAGSDPLAGIPGPRVHTASH